MKNILITGLNSYIGKTFGSYLDSFPDKYSIDKISVRDGKWKEINFSEYDTVIHLAAVVHKNEQKFRKETYFNINRDLAIDIANTAKSVGVKQFIFMSTMAVYGEIGEINKKLIISKSTNPRPNTYYGMSKMEAEKQLRKLRDNNFKLVIVRPPMIYGPNCPGNYAQLEKLACNIPLFPLINNQRSMLHINKLCEHLKSYIDEEVDGIFLPQDDEYVNTSKLFKDIAIKNNKKVYLSSLLGLFIKILGKRIGIFRKVFGNLVYEK
jgi:nucleoside-diphosphate-sugar epimerase